MISNTNKAIIMNIALISAMFIIISCSSPSAKSNTKQSDTTALSSEKVKVMTLQNKRINRIIEYSSSLMAFEEVHMAPTTPGRVEKITVEISDRVKKGQILAHMDQTQLQQALVQLHNAETDYKRFDTLNKTGSIAKQQYDAIKANYDIAKSNVEFLTANTRLLAPFDGIVSGKYYEDGELYSGSPTASGKAAIISLVQINPMKMIANVSEQFFPQIRIGMPASINCDIYPKDTYQGKVIRIYPTIDASTRTFQVEIEIPNNKEVLRPGMFARVNFQLDEVEALLVPALAILKMQGSNERYLFTAENGKAKRISVQLGQRINDDVELISSELKIGDQIIITGQPRLNDGVPIEIVPQ